MGEIFQFDQSIRRVFEENVIPFAVYQYVDEKIHVILVTNGLCDLMKTSREVLLARFQDNMYENVEPQDAYFVAQAALRFATDDEPYDVMYRERFGPDQDYQIVHAVGKHVTMRDGSRIAIVRYENVTVALVSNKLSKLAFESAVGQFYMEDRVATCILAKDRERVLYANHAFTKLMPPVKAYDSAITYWEYFHSSHPKEVEGYFESIAGKGQVILDVIDSNHSLVVEVRETTWSGEEALIVQAEAVDDVYMDKLTGLINQTYFELRASDWIKKFQKKSKDAVCIFYDIAGMKLINAQNGYEVGDRVLKQVSTCLKMIYDNALIARFDADHFCVLTIADDVISKIERANEAIEALRDIAKIEINAGVRVIETGKHLNISEVVDQAKMACDTIHSDAEKFYRFYDSDIEKQLQDLKFVNDHIDDAIKNREIQVYYQPVVRTLNNKLAGFEALARWDSPELGFLAPYRFITALEMSHQIHKIDCYVIEEICRQYVSDVENDIIPLPVSFNLSVLDFQMCDMFNFVQETAEKYGVPHSMLNIEITESILSEDDGLIAKEIERFHEAGYQVWMDDFGSGYSSLNSLKDYSFDQLKIDMVFLSSFTERSKQIITSIVQMAKNIGIHTLAEGVETEEQFEFLRGIGCEKVQGYYYGRPLPMKESREQVYSKHVTPETQEEACYVGKAGMTKIVDGEAFSIIEYKDGSFRFMYISKEYQQILTKVGVKSEEHSLEIIRSDEYLHDGFLYRISQAREQGGFIHFAFPYKSNYLTASIEILAEEGENYILKMSMSNTIIGLDTPKDDGRKEERSANKGEKKTILIADDEEIDFMILSQILKPYYNILYAENGAKAVELAKENQGRISAILLDMVMPEKSGIEVLRELHADEKLKFIPILAMTSALELEKEILTEGAARFLQKPFEKPEIILAKIRGEIEKAEIFREYSFMSMENLPVGVLVYRADESEEIIYANSKLLKLFGCKSMPEFKQHTGGTFKGMVLPDDYKRVKAEIEEQLKSGSDEEHDHIYYRIKTKQGEIREIDDFGQLVDDPTHGLVFHVFVGVK